MESIVVFDSGLGGITALAEAAAAMPQENFIYYGDTKNVPYGPKRVEDIRSFLDEMMDAVSPCHPKAVLLACNTATVTSAAYLREKYAMPIIGMEPAVKPAVEKDAAHKRVLVLSTEGTSKSEKLKNLVNRVDKAGQVDVLPLPNLVEFAENFEFDTPDVRADLETILSSYPLDEYGAVVLGCTHFIWYREIFREILPPDMQILDGNAGTIRQLMRRLNGNIQTVGEGRIRVHFTGGMDARLMHFLEGALPLPVSVLGEELCRG